MKRISALLAILLGGCAPRAIVCRCEAELKPPPNPDRIEWPRTESGRYRSGVPVYTVNLMPNEYELIITSGGWNNGVRIP